MNEWQKLSDKLTAETTGQNDAHGEVVPPEEIRPQLVRMLASPRFQSSPRCQSLLQYIVEEALAGRTATLKERTIGVAVFHRSATYDTSSDPVVRVAAGEIRKKIAQYYCETEHAFELRIGLPIGSYVPEFHKVAPDQPANPAPHGDGEEPGEGAPSRAWWFRWQAWAALSALILLTWFGLWSAEHWSTTHSDRARFLAPFVRAKSPTLLIIGQLRAGSLRLDTQLTHDPDPGDKAHASSDMRQRSTPVISLEDTETMVDLVSLLGMSHSTPSVSGAKSTAFSDLQKSPAILVGGLNNDWTIRLTHSLRFHLQQDSDGNEWWIADQKNPGKRWGDLHIETDDPRNVNQDFGLVVRLLNSETGQPVLVLAGITAGGTRAAEKFVHSEDSIEDFVRTAPRGWERKNCEILVSSQMIEGQAGPPEIIASTVW